MRKIMEKENYLCSEVLNNLKWGSTALPEGIEQDSVVMKEKIMRVLTKLTFEWVDRSSCNTVCKVIV